MYKIYCFTVSVIFLFSFTGNLFSQTDEYGTQAGNFVLSGLGLTPSHVNVINGSNFGNDTAGTIEAWVNQTTNSANTRTIISKGSGNAVSFLFGISSTNRLIFRIGTTDFINANGGTVPLNSWTHVAVTWSGKPNYKVKFYINGSQSGDSVISAAVWTNNSDPVRIGASQYFTGYVFNGMLDEVRYYNRAISRERISGNRFIGLCDLQAPSGASINSSSHYAGLVSSWTFNQSGTIAYDYINSNNGFYSGSAVSSGPNHGQPLPYNFVLKFNGGAYDYVKVPSNATFNQNADGTFEFWIKPVSFGTEQIVLSKGASTGVLSFTIGISISGNLYMGFGNYLAYNSSGQPLTLNQWNHIAITWATVGSNFELRFYKNGMQNGSPSTIVKNFLTNNDDLYIGNSQIYNLPLRGYLDELRLWHLPLTSSSIKYAMFVSGKNLSNSNLLANWGFDGTLNNYTSTTGINGSFENTGQNNLRFSGYMNDSIPGAYNANFTSHSTVINRGITPNPMLTNYNISAPFTTIPDNNLTGISDTITVSNIPGMISSAELFLAVDHTYIGDLIITVTSPNNRTRSLTNYNGGSGKNILSFFGDNFPNSVTNTSYLPPWGFIKPLSVFGDFSGSPANGKWRIRIVDGVSGDNGVLKGWGLKFDISTGNGNQPNVIPKEFNLYQNYPNPFNPSTTIKYDVPLQSDLKISVFNISGREITVLANSVHNPGSYEIIFNAANLSSGVYFIKFESPKYNSVKKMILMK
ncbi:MAG: T9SS type A sorting domain-containing protein [Ignavibacteria bacterium]|jgi:subtilisin-like proprotein convertase family protein|nr:T9SS type A sorting domain-containing protein [Ignavibacteria bacterium]